MPLDGKRPQAKAHNDACRQRAYRRRKKLAQQVVWHQQRQPDPVLSLPA